MVQYLRAHVCPSGQVNQPSIVQTNHCYYFKERSPLRVHVCPSGRTWALTSAPRLPSSMRAGRIRMPPCVTPSAVRHQMAYLDSAKGAAVVPA